MLPFPIMNTYGNTVLRTTIQQISASANNIWLLYSTGALYCMGVNYNGNFGIGNNTNNYLTWQLSRSDVRLVESFYSTSTAQGTIVITTDNKVYTAGNRGMVGSSSSSNTWYDVTSQFTFDISTIKKMQCNSNGTVFLTTTGDMYLLATTPSLFGETGSAITSTKLIESNVQEISTGDGTNYCLMYIKNNSLWVVGSNSSGKLGTGATSGNITTRTNIVISGYPYVSAISAGQTATWVVASADSTSLKYLFSCGAVGAGQIGGGFSSNLSTYTQVPEISGSLVLDFASCNKTSNFMNIRTSNGIYGSGNGYFNGSSTSAITTFQPSTVLTDPTKLTQMTGGASISFYVYNDLLYWSHNATANWGSPLGIMLLREEPIKR